MRDFVKGRQCGNGLGGEDVRHVLSRCYHNYCRLENAADIRSKLRAESGDEEFNHDDRVPPVSRRKYIEHLVLKTG